MSYWQQYIEKTKNNSPRRLLVRAIELVKNKGCALDIGAGALNDSRYLIEMGFGKVIALDIEEVPELSKDFDNNIFTFQKIAIEDYDFPNNAFDLINAQFVLPFVSGNEIERVMIDMKKSLHTGGLLVGQFFGPKDSWSNRKDVTVFTKKEVEEFLKGLDIIFFEEEESDKKTPLESEKHWHTFHFIARL